MWAFSRTSKPALRRLPPLTKADVDALETESSLNIPTEDAATKLPSVGDKVMGIKGTGLFDVLTGTKHMETIQKFSVPRKMRGHFS